jgi:hypothetical protein
MNRTHQLLAFVLRCVMVVTACGVREIKEFAILSVKIGGVVSQEPPACVFAKGTARG